MESERPQINLNKMIISRYWRKLISRYRREINPAPNLQRLIKTIQTLNQMFLIMMRFEIFNTINLPEA